MSDSPSLAVFSVLMVCTGNIGRSPMMERIMRHELSERASSAHFDIRSAGTWGQDGQSMEPGAIRALEQRRVDAADFAAAPLSADLVAASHLVLVATREHRSEVVSMVPGAVRRTFTLHELARIAQSAPPVPTTSADQMQRLLDAVAWAAQVRGAVPRPNRPEDDDLPDPLGAPDAVYRERAAAIAASVERIVPYLLGEPQAG